MRGTRSLETQKPNDDTETQKNQTTYPRGPLGSQVLDTRSTTMHQCNALEYYSCTSLDTILKSFQR